METDAEYASRVDEAVNRGYIIRHLDPDGVVRYEFTQLGLKKWIAEKIQAAGAGFNVNV